MSSGAAATRPRNLEKLREGMSRPTEDRAGRDGPARGPLAPARPGCGALPLPRCAAAAALRLAVPGAGLAGRRRAVWPRLARPLQRYAARGGARRSAPNPPRPCHAPACEPGRAGRRPGPRGHGRPPSGRPAGRPARALGVSGGSGPRARAGSGPFRASRSPRVCGLPRGGSPLRVSARAARSGPGLPGPPGRPLGRPPPHGGRGPPRPLRRGG